MHTDLRLVMGVLTVARRIGLVFFFKQKTAYEMRISDWSSDVCSSDLFLVDRRANRRRTAARPTQRYALLDQVSQPALRGVSFADDFLRILVLHLLDTKHTAFGDAQRFGQQLGGIQRLQVGDRSQVEPGIG